MDLLALSLVGGLATWRFASLLHTEDAFGWLRKWIGIENDAQGYPAVYPGTFLGRIFDCFWCLSWVAAAPITALISLVAQLNAAWAILIWLGGSTVSIWLEKQIMRTQSR